MILTAEHFDGFSELLLGWKATICDSSGEVQAKWFKPGGRGKAEFTVSFDDIDIAAIGITLSGMQARYDGGVDDFPHHILQFTDGTDNISVHLRAGTNWPTDVQPEVDAFYRIWKPIAKRVESHPEMPQRR